MKNISLVIVDAVSPTIEEKYDVALPNIQKLIDAEVAEKIYEITNLQQNLKYKSNLEKIHWDNNKMPGINGEVILAGGSLGNKHYKVLVSLLERISKENKVCNIHIPFDCTYSFIQKYDGGERWAEGCLGNKDMPVLKYYTKLQNKYSTESIHFWDTWEEMVKFFEKEK